MHLADTESQHQGARGVHQPEERGGGGSYVYSLFMFVFANI